ncbi:hypothetical protein KI387_022981 [Taxus chinensis]|uniref:Heat shock protein 70 n=1 Tax=Taxus chinensis TaxID=29808 RepID=A0AA38G409_TAXCH|nr:hypothetical protein KI387_022981 [Taxus chinensis]
MCEVKNAVIIVPAYFNDAQKRATIDAAKLTGLNVLRVINEPIVVALTYVGSSSGGSNVMKRQYVVIFDLGGGIFDVSMVKVRSSSEIEVYAVGGDMHLGGRQTQGPKPWNGLYDNSKYGKLQLDNGLARTPQMG